MNIFTTYLSAGIGVGIFYILKTGSTFESLGIKKIKDKLAISILELMVITNCIIFWPIFLFMVVGHYIGEFIFISNLNNRHQYIEDIDMWKLK